MYRAVILSFLGLFLFGELAQGDVIEAVIPAIRNDLGNDFRVSQFIYSWTERIALIRKEYEINCGGGSVWTPKTLLKQSVSVERSTARAVVFFPGLQFKLQNCLLNSYSPKQEPVSGQLGDNKVTLVVDLANAGSGCKVTIKQFFYYQSPNVNFFDNVITKKIESHKEYQNVKNRLKDHLRYNMDQKLGSLVGKQYTVPVPCK